MQNTRRLQVSQTQLRTLQRFPRHRGVWRALGIRLGRGTRVVVGSNHVQLVRTAKTGR